MMRKNKFSTDHFSLKFMYSKGFNMKRWLNIIISLYIRIFTMRKEINYSEGFLAR